jgi:hypothetical protein
LSNIRKGEVLSDIRSNAQQAMQSSNTSQKLDHDVVIVTCSSLSILFLGP